MKRASAADDDDDQSDDTPPVAPPPVTPPVVATEAQWDSAVIAALDPRQTNPAFQDNVATELARANIGRDYIAAIRLRQEEQRTGRTYGRPVGSPDAAPFPTMLDKVTDADIAKTTIAMLDPRMTNLTSIEYTARYLEQLGRQGYAGALRARITELQRGTVGIVAPPPVVPSTPPVVAPPPVVPSTPPVVVAPPPGTPPIGPAEVEPDADPRGSIALARILVAEESSPNWKRVHPDVIAWQKRNGLGSDGKFGPKSALFMAQDVGILPLVRYWSGWDKNAELQKYWASLADLASMLDATNPTHAAALRLSAANEDGDGWPSSTGAVSSGARKTQASALGNAIALAESTGQTLRKVVETKLAEWRDAILAAKGKAS
jgi:hypothetical protein